MICFNCKAQIEDGLSFCPECGCRQMTAAGGAAAFDATQAVFDATQAAPFDATQAASFDATQAASFDATQAASFDATQAASFDATQAASFDATQAMPYGGYVPPVNNMQMPSGNAPQEPPKKNNKGLIIAVSCAAIVLVAVLAVLAFKFLPELGLFDKETEKESKKAKTTQSITESISAAVPDISITDAFKVTVPEYVEITTFAFAVPTIPHGDDTVDIGSVDIFNPTTNAVVTTARPKPTTPPTVRPTTRPATTRRPTQYYEPTTYYYYDYTERYTEAQTEEYWEEYTTDYYYDEYIETPYALVDIYEDQAHIGGYLYEDGTSTYFEYGYFYANGNICVYSKVSDGEIVVERNNGNYDVYVRENYSSVFQKADVSSETGESIYDSVTNGLISLGYSADAYYPDRKYDYLYDFDFYGIGYVEDYYVVENGVRTAELYVDLDSGYYAAVLDLDGNYVYKANFIDTTGSMLPYDFR